MASVESNARIALVTGAAGAIGRAVVGRLQTEGYRVAGLDLHGEAGDLPLAADVTDRRQMKLAAGRVAAELGTISVLVTAHGHHAVAPFGSMPRDDWRRLLEVHLGGTVNACAAVVPGMVAAHHGAVVTLSLWLASSRGAGESYLAAATGTILAFTKSFSAEVATKGVRVNCIAMEPLEDEAATREELPTRRDVRPSDIADTVSFLLRDGDFFVGQVLCPAAGAVI
jgi:2-hydroxycyclohexanecarboxyl-CoA dehydrogenase